MDETFPAALAYTLRNEGGLADNPLDRGGLTNCGICFSTFTKYRAKKGQPAPTADDLRNISPAEVGAFYRSEYWAPMAGPTLLQPAVAMALFDAGVLNGVGTIGLIAQTVATTLSKQALTADGQLGAKSVLAINACQPGPFLEALVLRLMRRYATICANDSTQFTFFDGWAKRCLRYQALLISAAPTVA